MQINSVSPLTSPLAIERTVAVAGSYESRVGPRFRVAGGGRLPAEGGPEPNGEEIAQALKEMAEKLSLLNSIKMSYDESVERVIVKIIDGQTNEIIRQIPPEGMVRFLRAFNEMMGLLINERI